MVSITPFGQDGPYAHYKAPDIVGMAMGGFMYLTGDGDRPPLRVGFPHFYLHGAAAGATGAMIAHTHRSLTGEGQHVDVSCQQAVAKTLAHAPQSWDMEGVVVKRMGAYRQTSGDTLVRINWRCKDGYVNYMPQGGGPGVARSTRALLDWMDEEGMGDEDLKAVNWEELGYGQVRPEIMEMAVAPLEAFFAAHTKEELARGSVERRILLFPVATPRDILDHPQLKARNYFKEVLHPELNVAVSYPGPFVKSKGEELVGPAQEASTDRGTQPRDLSAGARTHPGAANHTEGRWGDLTSRKPLGGLKVLDFCWVAAGPMTTKYLAEYGATVLRVESAKRPETLRKAAPFKDGVSGLNRSGYFCQQQPQQIRRHHRHAPPQG